MNGSIITNLGKKITLNRAYKGTPDYTQVSQFSVGVINATPTVGTTALTQHVPISGMETIDDCESVTGWTSSTNSITLNSTTYKRGSNALNLIKEDGTTANVRMAKVTTSLDFTGKDLWCWVYLDETATYNHLVATDCLSIRFGSDTSNYYLYTRDKTDLAVGWNYVTFSADTADSSIGTPIITACDFTRVEIITDDASDTISAGNLIFDQFELVSSGDYTKNIGASYPIFDETNNEVEIQSVLSTTDAIGFNINGFGLLNTDTTPKLGTESTFTTESKSVTDEFTFIEIHRIE